MFTSKNLQHLMIRLITALIVSHFIVVHDAEETWAELFTRKYYYLSVVYSMVIAYLLIEFVFQVTNHLNTTSGHNLTSKRIKKQFFRGFLLTGILAFVLATILFWLNGQNIFESNYFEKLYPSILLFIFTVNVIYMFFYHYRFIPKTRYKLVKSDQVLSNKEKSNLHALIYHENRLCVALDFNGASSILPRTIEETMSLLNAHYYQINRKVIVHYAAILTVMPYGARHLKIELIIDADLPDGVELIVSKRKKAQFKQWFSEQIHASQSVP